MPTYEEIKARRRARLETQGPKEEGGFRPWVAAGIRGASGLVPGGPWGSVAGAVGEGLAQTVEERDSYNGWSMAGAAGLGFIPGGRAASMARAAGKSAAMSGGGTAMMQQTEEGLHVPTGEDLKWIGGTSVVGGLIGAGGQKLLTRGQKPPVDSPSISTPPTAPKPDSRMFTLMGSHGSPDPADLDNTRRATMKATRNLRREDNFEWLETPPNERQAIADNLTQLGTPNALDEAARHYKKAPSLEPDTWKDEAIDAPDYLRFES